MTYYERIQRSIDYMEEHLEEELTIEACAQAAFMSVSGYYRMFLSIVGYSVKDYIRRRRLTLALEELRQGESVIEAAVKYQYNSADSFTRAFKNQFGILPSKIRAVSRDQIMNRFARLDMMEKYFDTENRELIEKYPDIKVIRKLEDMKVACFTYFGEDPETHSFEKLRDWAYAHGAVFHEEGCRVFGYNHPDPSNVDDPEELYGYEVCVTIPEELYETLGDVPEDFVKGTYDGVKRRILQGGKYAVMSVKRDADGELGFNIMRAWKRFGKWLEEGKYVWGGDQYLEEHLDFTEDGRHVGGVDLYISVKDAPKQQLSDRQEEVIPAYRAAAFRTEGTDSGWIAQECWGKTMDWLRANHLDPARCRFFQYNKGFDRRPPFFHVILVALPENFAEEQSAKPESVKFVEFPGGKYMTVHTDASHLTETWMLMEKWRKDSGITAGEHQWVEEWILKDVSYPGEKVKVCYPIG